MAPDDTDYLLKKHITGSCRTEGYYKMDPQEKARTKYHLQREGAFDQAFNLRNLEGTVTKGPKTTSKGVSREQRSNQRRIKAILENDNFAGSKLLEFNQLKVSLFEFEILTSLPLRSPPTSGLKFNIHFKFLVSSQEYDFWKICNPRLGSFCDGIHR